MRLPSNFTAEVALHGSTVYVVDPFGPAFGQPDRFYASTNGRAFSTRPDPCRHLLDSALIDVVATSATHVDLLCVGNPGMSRATKNVYRSVNTARTDTSLGDASSGNQDFGIQSELAASASGNLAVTSFSSGDWIYIHDNAPGNWTTPVNLADGGVGWNDVVYSGNQTAWVVYGPVDFTGVGQLRVTHDGGRHWRKAAL